MLVLRRRAIREFEDPRLEARAVELRCDLLEFRVELRRRYQ